MVRKAEKVDDYIKIKEVVSVLVVEVQDVLEVDNDDLVLKSRVYEEWNVQENTSFLEKVKNDVAVLNVVKENVIKGIENHPSLEEP